MKDLNREQVAFELFKLMNESNKDPYRVADKGWAAMWDYYREHGWNKGYLKLADHIVARGYKP